MEILDRLSEALPDCSIELKTFVKNNGVSLDGIMIRKDGHDAAPVYYLQNLPEDISEAVRIIVEDMKKQKLDELEQIKLDNFKTLQDKIRIKLVNRMMNKDLVCVDVTGNIAAAFYVDLGDNKTTMVTEELLRLWNMDPQNLYMQAVMNMKEEDISLRSIMDVIAGLTGTDVQDEEINTYVLTTKKGVYGASVLLYPNLLNSLREKFGDIYLLPSSVHEWLIVPEPANPVYLEQMVREVNNTSVRNTDILDYNIYRYDGQFHMVEQEIER